MRWYTAQPTELTRRSHQSLTKVMHPHAINDHARQERIVGLRQPLTNAKRRPVVGKLGSSLGELDALSLWHSNRRWCGRDFLLRLLMIATMKQAR